jgi:hypothetical protein
LTKEEKFKEGPVDEVKWEWGTEAEVLKGRLQGRWEDSGAEKGCLYSVIRRGCDEMGWSWGRHGGERGQM